nr:hypothetical protein CFP56_22575 [Quercus suber]
MSSGSYDGQSTMALPTDDHIPEIFPSSSAAALAFNDLCDKLKSQPPDPNLDHQRRFVVMGPLLPLRQYLFTFVDSPSSFSTDADEIISTVEPEPDPIVQTGHFELSLSERPLLPSPGWTLGRGRSKLEHRGVDMVLSSRDLRSMHAGFRFNEYSGSTVKAFRDLELDGEVPLQSQARPLLRIKHSISFNELRFRVERHHAPHLETIKQAKLREYLRDIRFDTSTLHPLVTATPSNKDEFIGRWKLHGIAGQGGGEVTVDAATVTITGDMLAVKRPVRDKLQERAHNAQIKKSNDVERMLRNSEETAQVGISFLLRLLRSSIPGMHNPGAKPSWIESTCLSSPSAWEHSIKSSLNTMNMVPRCVRSKSASRKYFSVNTAQHMCTPEPGTCGTVGYLAPEFENSEYLSQQIGVYDCAVDIFALGVVGQELFCPSIQPTALRVLSGGAGITPRNPFRKPVDLARIAAMTELCHNLSSNTEAKGELPQLVACMLKISHKKRITAREVLASTVLEAVMTDIARRTEDSFDRKRKHGF